MTAAAAEPARRAGRGSGRWWVAVVLVLVAACLLASTIWLGALLVGQTRTLDRSVAATTRLLEANIRTLGQVQRELLRMDVALERPGTTPERLELQRAFVAQRMREATNSYQLGTLGSGGLRDRARSLAQRWTVEVEPLIARVVADPAGSPDARAEAIAGIEQLDRDFLQLTTRSEARRKAQAGLANTAATDLLHRTRWLFAALVVTLTAFAVAAGLALWSLVRANRRRDATARELVAVNDALREVSEVATRNAQAKADFLASMSHEIRTPLNAVIGLNELVLRTDLTDQQRGWLTTAQNSGTLLLELINDILIFSALDAGEVRLFEDPVDLDQLLEDTRAMFEGAAAAKGLDLRVHRDPDLDPRRLADEVRLRQVLVNLVGNAVKFTDRGSVEAVVAPGPDAGTVRLRVIDTGVGVGPAVAGAVFDPFSQGDASPARRHGGTGLGLAICDRIVGLMGGTIELAPRPGGGTVVEVVVPLEPAGAPEPSAATGAVAEVGDEPWRTLSVLVAEDDPVNQLVTRHLLETLGIHADVVDDGAAACAAVRDGHYDLVLMDIHMPDVDGVEATRRIRDGARGGARPRLVAMTASALAGDRERFLASGLDDYVSKPVRREDLAAALDRTVAARGVPSAG
ncbi:MAG: ATP-binding protein [Microthrixaceae bacterium]